MKRILGFAKSLKFLFMPDWWLRNYGSDHTVDQIINHIIEKDLIVKIGRFEAFTENGTKVWIVNYPYAFASVDGFIGLPKRTTALKFRKYLESKNSEWFKHI